MPMAVTECKEPACSTSGVAVAAGRHDKGPPPPQTERAWAWFRSIGAPKLHVAPMVDQSELPFRLLCRRYGATCAYTPMLHARIFSQDPKYRDECLTTTSGDRPLLVQFCSSDPDHLLTAARMVEAMDICDGIDINFGCPQRIAKRGNYGAFLMDDLPRVQALVRKLSQNLSIPVTAKIRVFPDIAQTVAYARMVEAAGACLLAVHGRTREQKDLSATRADWDPIKAVKEALHIPVLANGNIRHMGDALECMRYTGCDGVLSAEGLLTDPALYSPERPITMAEAPVVTPLESLRLAREYLELVLACPVPMRMVRGHMHRLIGDWLAEHVDLRAQVNLNKVTTELYLEVVDTIMARAEAAGRQRPVPALSATELAAIERAAAKQAAIDEQEREAEALAKIEAQDEEEYVVDWGDWALAAADVAETAAAAVAAVTINEVQAADAAPGEATAAAGTETGECVACDSC